MAKELQTLNEQNKLALWAELSMRAGAVGGR